MSLPCAFDIHFSSLHAPPWSHTSDITFHTHQCLWKLCGVHVPPPHEILTIGLNLSASSPLLPCSFERSKTSLSELLFNTFPGTKVAQVTTCSHHSFILTPAASPLIFTASFDLLSRFLMFSLICFVPYVFCLPGLSYPFNPAWVSFLNDLLSLILPFRRWRIFMASLKVS